LNSEHARLSPSSRHRWAADACPGSAREEARYPDKPNKYSIAGTFFHQLACECLETGYDAKDWPSLQIAYGVGEKYPEPTHEDLAAVQIYLDQIRFDLDKNPGELWIEKKVVISQEHWGTSDAAIWSPETGLLRIYDYKHGSGIFVPVENNKQLKSYACGVFSLINNAEAVLEVENVIIQPRAGGKAVRRWKVDREEFLTWPSEIERDIAAASHPDAPLNPGKWCKFCKHAPNCEALRERALITAQADFSDLHIHPSELQGEELAAALRQASIAETYFKAVRDHAFDIAKRGGSVPGHKLVKKRPVRKWISEKKAATILINRGVDQPYADPKIKSPAAVEKEVGDKGITRDLVVSESGGLTLALNSDGRPAVASSAAADFSEKPSI